MIALSATFALVTFLDYKVYSTDNGNNTAERRLDKWKPKNDDYTVYAIEKNNNNNNKEVVYDKKSKRMLAKETLELDDTCKFLHIVLLIYLCYTFS